MKQLIGLLLLVGLLSLKKFVNLLPGLRPSKFFLCIGPLAEFNTLVELIVSFLFEGSERRFTLLNESIFDWYSAFGVVFDVG